MDFRMVRQKMHHSTPCSLTPAPIEHNQNSHSKNPADSTVHGTSVTWKHRPPSSAKCRHQPKVGRFRFIGGYIVATEPFALPTNSHVGIAIRQVSPGFVTKHTNYISWKLIEVNLTDVFVDWESIVYPEIVYHLVLNKNPEDIEYCLPKLDDLGDR